MGEGRAKKANGRAGESAKTAIKHARIAVRPLAHSPFRRFADTPFTRAVPVDNHKTSKTLLRTPSDP
jgi:hypothetical protein